MVSFRGQKKLRPRPSRSPLGIYFKISDEHPQPFHMRSPSPGITIYFHKAATYFCCKFIDYLGKKPQEGTVYVLVSSRT